MVKKNFKYRNNSYLPKGFQLTPPNRIPLEIFIKKSTLYFQSYSHDKKYILVVGLVLGKKNSEIVFLSFCQIFQLIKKFIS